MDIKAIIAGIIFSVNINLRCNVHFCFTIDVHCDVVYNLWKWKVYGIENEKLGGIVYMQFDNGLTWLSDREVLSIQDGYWSADEALRYLTGNLKLRTFTEVLCRYFPEEELKKRLISGLCEIEPQNRESISRSVRNWLSGKYAPTSREELFKICFALALDEAQASELLSFMTDGGIHIRNTRELIFAYCLRTKKGYGYALELLASLQPPPQEGTTFDHLTKSLLSAFETVQTDDELKHFYQQHFSAFGELHNTAYLLFMRFWELLSQPALSYSNVENKYSTVKIVDGYLRMELPLNKRTSCYSVLQKTIRKFWPNVTNITRMLSREEDVSRRVLLLMYLITEGGVTEKDSQAYLLDEDLTDSERFEEHYWRLNAMLNDCGFSRLDPRNVFDWLVLYCIKSSDDETMNERMQTALHAIFDTETV